MFDAQMNPTILLGVVCDRLQLGDHEVPTSNCDYWIAFQAHDGMRNIVIEGPFTCEKAMAHRESCKRLAAAGDKYSTPYIAGSKEEAEKLAPTFL